MPWIVVFGVLVNGAAALRVGRGTSLNERAVFLHVMDIGITKGVDIYVRKVALLGDPADADLRRDCARGALVVACKKQNS